MNNSKIKDRQHDTWAAAAEGWRRRDALLRKGAEPVSQRMLELTRITHGSKLLDIASGTGEPAITAATIVGNTGKVIGTDLADEMLAVARDKIVSAGLTNIEFQCIDAEQLDIAEGTFDAVTIRWGLMFMPEPQACLTAARQSLRTGGRISVACWAAPDKNPFVSVLIQTLSNYMDIPTPPPGTPGIFAFASPDRLRNVLVDSGFNNITLEEMAIDVIEVDDGRAYWEAMSDLAAPVMALVDQLDAPARANYIDDVINTANSLKHDTTLRMRGTTWIASADK